MGLDYGAAGRTGDWGRLRENQSYFFASGCRRFQSSGGKLMRQKPGLGFVNSSAVLNFRASARVTSLTAHSAFSVVRTFNRETTVPWFSETPISTSAPWAFTIIV